jgi:hypothetical protein
MVRMSRLLFVALSAAILTVSVWAADGDKPLDNAEIVKLTKADMGDAVIIAKINGAASVKFATDTDDLVKLKDAGVSKAVIAAMLERSSAAPPKSPNGSAAASVSLVSTDGTVPLTMADGEVSTIVAPFVGMKRFVSIPEISATVRTKDRKPSVTLATDKDPHKIYWVVKLDQDKDKDDMNRSMDVESPGMWGGVMSSAPDDDFMVKCDITQQQGGVWKFTPVKDLKPGEYGLYVGRGEQTAGIYAFGVDK